MLVKKIPVLILLVVSSNLTGQIKEAFFIGKWIAHPHFEIYGMGFDSANNTVTCITDTKVQLYQFGENGNLEISGSRHTVSTVLDDEGDAEIMEVSRGARCKWTLDVERQCIRLEWANNKSSLLIYSSLGPHTLLVTTQDMLASGLPAPQFRVFVFERQ